MLYYCKKQRERVVAIMEELKLIWAKKKYRAMHVEDIPQLIHSIGTNCYGFIEAVFHSFGMELPLHIRRSAINCTQYMQCRSVISSRNKNRDVFIKLLSKMQPTYDTMDPFAVPMWCYIAEKKQEKQQEQSVKASEKSPIAFSSGSSSPFKYQCTEFIIISSLVV